MFVGLTLFLAFMLAWGFSKAIMRIYPVERPKSDEFSSINNTPTTPPVIPEIAEIIVDPQQHFVEEELQEEIELPEIKQQINSVSCV